MAHEDTVVQGSRVQKEARGCDARRLFDPRFSQPWCESTMQTIARPRVDGAHGFRSVSDRARRAAKNAKTCSVLAWIWTTSATRRVLPLLIEFEFCLC